MFPGDDWFLNDAFERSLLLEQLYFVLVYDLVRFKIFPYLSLCDLLKLIVQFPQKLNWVADAHDDELDRAGDPLPFEVVFCRLRLNELVQNKATLDNQTNFEVLLVDVLSETFPDQSSA